MGEFSLKYQTFSNFSIFSIKDTVMSSKMELQNRDGELLLEAFTK